MSRLGGFLPLSILQFKIFASLFFAFSFLFAPIVKSQPSSSPTTGSPLEVRNAVGTVLLAGLVGGVLGLSTLSFYDRPQDNIRNIYFGAGGGMILATIYMTLEVATSPLPANLKGPVGQILPILPAIDFEKKTVGVSYTVNFD